MSEFAGITTLVGKLTVQRFSNRSQPFVLTWDAAVTAKKVKTYDRQLSMFVYFCYSGKNVGFVGLIGFD